MTNCGCGISEDNKTVRVCPKHYVELMKDSNIHGLLNFEGKHAKHNKELSKKLGVKVYDA